MKTRGIWRMLALLMIVLSLDVQAQNPIIKNQFTADPSARVFNGRVYVYPSHDIPPAPGKGRANWFVMEDYHVFSSENLVDWTDHGMIVHQNRVPWVKADSYSMWAPDCIYRNGKYYFYFPSTPADTSINGRGFTVGVAVAQHPEGPFVPEAKPITGVKGIDPNVFIDKDGQAYLYWSQGNIYAAKLKDNMLELASTPVIIGQLPQKGLKEGPYLFERNGVYYMTYPHVDNKTERLEYAVGASPLGPFTYRGVLMDESPTGCWTNHHSVIEFKDQWYLFYHHNDLSPTFDKNRSVRIDSLFFEPNGDIRKVNPTLRGVGLTRGRYSIQIDRYSRVSEQGADIAYLDQSDPFKGWKVRFTTPGSWLQYNSVDFGSEKPGKLILRASSTNGGIIRVRTGSLAGPILAEIRVPKGFDMRTIEAKAKGSPKGVQHVFVESEGTGKVEIDWIRFE